MAEFNPFLPELRSNPYPLYKAMREGSPVQWSEWMNLWLLTRYDDNLAVLRDSARFSSERNRATNRFVQQLEAYREQSGPLGRTLTMLSLDPPAHTHMRNLVNKAFSPRVIDRIRPHLAETAEDLLDALPDPTRVDAVRDLAVPLPVIAIAEVLGVPAEERQRFKDWSTDIAGMLSGTFQPVAALEKARVSSNELADYFRDQIAIRRREPREDLLSALIAAEDQGDLLTEDEMLATCILLLVAGNETTTNLIGNGLLALLQNPDERRRLQADPALIGPAVEEMLRYDSPVQMTSRVAQVETELRGQRLEPGQLILCLLGAANRDPAQFADPDRFDITRRDNRHLAFGYGIHYCLGAPLAIAEAQVAIMTLLKRFPEPDGAFEEPQWGDSFILHGLKSLPITSRSARP